MPQPRGRGAAPVDVGALGQRVDELGRLRGREPLGALGLGARGGGVVRGRRGGGAAARGAASGSGGTLLERRGRHLPRAAAGRRE